MKRQREAEPPYTKTDAGGTCKPTIGAPCGVTGSGMVFVNFTTEEVGRDERFAATSTQLCNVALHRAFNQAPGNTRLRATVVWLALRCDLFDAAVGNTLTRIATDASTRVGAKALWALRSTTPLSLFVAAQTLQNVPVHLQLSSPSPSHALSTSTVYDDDVSACVKTAYDCVVAKTAAPLPPSVCCGEADKYPSAFYATLLTRGGGSGGGATRSVSFDALLSMLHRAYHTRLESAINLQTLLCIFSALSNCRRHADRGVVFCYRDWRASSSGSDGLEALLLKHLPASYVKPKRFLTSYGAALARPTAALWWWILKTADLVEVAEAGQLCTVTAVLFELTSNVLRCEEQTVLWCVFGSLIQLRLGRDRLCAWLNVTNIDAANADASLFSVPWLHGLSVTSTATTRFVRAHDAVTDLCMEYCGELERRERAALYEHKGFLEQLRSRSLVDASDVAYFEREL